MPADITTSTTSSSKKLHTEHGKPHAAHSFFHSVKLRALLTSGCLLLAGTATAAERIIDLNNQQEISRDTLLSSLKKTDFVLLGELHDNPHHHTTRAWLLEQLAVNRPLVVVAEHLARDHRAAADGELLPALEAAGFDAKNWRWPLHESLFRQARQSARAVHGGNIPRPLARAIVQQKENALPTDIATAIHAAPLSQAARKTLKQDLLDSHCGQIPANLIPGLSLAQRARDAAMALALREAKKTATSVVLVAGNGHVRRDYGIPVLLDQLTPARTTITVGFLETGTPLNPQDGALKARYDFVWITDPATRENPCLNFPKR